MREHDLDERLLGQVDRQSGGRLHFERDEKAGHLDLVLFEI